MARLQITLACCGSDRSRPVLDGHVPIRGCDVVSLMQEPGTIFPVVVREESFDVAEMSMSSHIVLTSRGDPPPYYALPIFHSRVFRHSSIYIRTDREIERPEDLAGRTIGLQEYQQTACLWVRGMLADQYGVAPESIHWRTAGLNAPGRGERIALKLADRFDVQPLGPGQTLTEAIAAGEIDAIVSPQPPHAFADPEVPVGRLFPDYRAAEADYYRATGFFPIMHCIGVRRSLAERHPWLPREVYAAFAEARRLVLRDLQNLGVLKTTLPWISAEYEATVALMGPDIWPYGLAANRKELEAMARYSFDQGLSERMVEVDELFHPSMIGTT